MNEIFIKLVIAFSLLAIAIFFLWFGNTIIRRILLESKSSNDEESDDAPLKNGRRIGFYERILYFIGIITQNWILISIVVALKTISRYKELDEQIKSEYFLIGSLLSLIYVIVISTLFIVFLKIFGIDFIDRINELLTFNIKLKS